MTTLDVEIHERGWKSLDYLKIDAEGYDFHVLKGSEQLLSEKAVKFIQFEYNRPWAEANATLAGALSLLRSHGYACYLIRSDGLFEHDYARYGEYFFYSNFLAVAPGSADIVQRQVKGRT